MESFINYNFEFVTCSYPPGLVVYIILKCKNTIKNLLILRDIIEFNVTARGNVKLSVKDTLWEEQFFNTCDSIKCRKLILVFYFLIANSMQCFIIMKLNIKITCSWCNG